MASKLRKRKVETTLVKGNQLIPSASDRTWYAKELKALTNSMLAEYKEAINEAFEDRSVVEFYAKDSSPTSVFTRLFKRLDDKWSGIFKVAGINIARKLINRVDKNSKTSTWNSLSSLGIKEPREAYSKNLLETAKAGEEFNVTLISGIHTQVHKKLLDVVFLSLTSPNPDEQGQPAIIKALNEIGIKEKKRCELIARDQTTKLYAALNTERMRDNGITQFEWVHSSAGKEPRKSHKERNGSIFELDDPRLWEVGFQGATKADLGPPGYAINCRCRAIPVVDLS